MKTKLTIELPPAHFQRPRPNKRTGQYYSPHDAAKKDWQQLIQNQMRLHGAHILEGPIGVEHHIGAEKTILVVRQIIGEDIKRPKGVRADIDNVVKFQNDAMQKLVFFDDRQVVSMAARFI